MEPFKARLPHDLKAWLEARATRTFRSTTMELVALLEEARTRYGDDLAAAARIPTGKKATGMKRVAA